MARTSSGNSPHNRKDLNLGLTADSGSAQAGATPLQIGFNEIATVATIGDSVLMPAADQVGQIVRIYNAGANSADVFPQSGENLGAGADTAAALAAGANISYICVASGLWDALS